MGVYKHCIPCTAWSSGLGAHVPHIFHKSKQIEEKATSVRSCSVPHWCWQKACCFLQGWSSGEGTGMRIKQGYRSWAKDQISGKEHLHTTPYSPCGLEKVPSESVRAQWLSLGCCQETSAVLKWGTGKTLCVLSGSVEGKDGC